MYNGKEWEAARKLRDISDDVAAEIEELFYSGSRDGECLRCAETTEEGTRCRFCTSDLLYITKKLVVALEEALSV